MSGFQGTQDAIVEYCFFFPRMICVDPLSLCGNRGIVY